jgi:4-diphosphocytidyl-2-C-methyl-D-erythritol kinase
LTKNLPVASGIGGGSSDAAAALRALNRLWKLGWGASQLREAAQGLGADVPVCIEALPAWMTGTGETSQPLALPAFDAVLVNPRRALSTAAVYREFDALALGARFARRDPPKWAGRELCLSDLAAWGNDLEAPAQRLTPELFAVRAALARRDPRLTGLSGSGATMFAIVESADGARALAAALALAHPDWWIQPVQLGEL